MRFVWKTLGYLLLAGAVAFLGTGCGDDESSNNGGSGNNGMTTDVGDVGGGDVGMDAGEDTGAPDMAPEDMGEDMPSDDMGGGMEEDMRMLKECVLLSPSLGDCDPLCQEGCEAGEHCVTEQATQTDPPSSVCEISGAAGQGADCGTSQDCGVGFFCDENASGGPVCRQYCRPDSDVKPACPFGLTCRPFVAELRIGKCVEKFDECTVVPESCDDGEACYDTDEGKRCAPYNPDGTPDMECMFSYQCNLGYRCVDVGTGDLRCKATCDPDAADDDCESGTSCREVTGEGGETRTWGACF